jgi:hypothetical protein
MRSMPRNTITSPFAIFLGLVTLCGTAAANPVMINKSPYDYQWLHAGLLVAWLVGIPILLLLTRLVKGNENSLERIILVGIACSIVSLPLLVFAMDPYILMGWYRVTGEIIVIVVAAGIIRKYLSMDNLSAVICVCLMNTPLVLLLR